MASTPCHSSSSAYQHWLKCSLSRQSLRSGLFDLDVWLCEGGRASWLMVLVCSSCNTLEEQSKVVDKNGEQLVHEGYYESPS